MERIERALELARAERESRARARRRRAEPPRPGHDPDAGGHAGRAGRARPTSRPQHARADPRPCVRPSCCCPGIVGPAAQSFKMLRTQVMQRHAAARLEHARGAERRALTTARPSSRQPGDRDLGRPGRHGAAGGLRPARTRACTGASASEPTSASSTACEASTASRRCSCASEGYERPAAAARRGAVAPVLRAAGERAGAQPGSRR